MIYVFEEDTKVANIIKQALDKAEYDTYLFSDAKELLSSVLEKKPCLVIIDVMSEKVSGAALIESLRALPIKVPRVIITTYWMEYNRISNIDFGEDTVVFKPFNATALVGAVNRALHPDNYDKENICVRDIVIKPKTREVYANGEKIKLARKEYTLLLMLAENPERVFTREQLFNCLWQSEYLGQSRTVDVQLSSLRRKLKSSGDCIKTKRGKGYFLEIL